MHSRKRYNPKKKYYHRHSRESR